MAAAGRCTTSHVEIYPGPYINIDLHQVASYRSTHEKAKYVYKLCLNFPSPPGYRGKSIRTETSWMTPVEFAKLASGQAESCWRKDIQWEGKPLGVLTEVIVSVW